MRTNQQQQERHLSTLSRRLNYLSKRRDELGSANSYDLAEIYALIWALEILKSFKEEYGRKSEKRN